MSFIYREPLLYKYMKNTYYISYRFFCEYRSLVCENRSVLCDDRSLLREYRFSIWRDSLGRVHLNAWHHTFKYVLCAWKTRNIWKMRYIYEKYVLCMENILGVFICMCDITHLWICMIWLIRICDMTHSSKGHDSFMSMCDMNHSILRCGWFVCVPCLIYDYLYMTHSKARYEYGVALVSRIDKIICLFCKRDLWKRQYSAKETYNSIDPTDRSHPGTWMRGMPHLWIILTCVMQMCDMTPVQKWFHATWQIYKCNMTHSHVWHDTFKCVMWLNFVSIVCVTCLGDENDRHVSFWFMIWHICIWEMAHLRVCATWLIP